MPWESLAGHERIVEQLRRSFSSGRFPHALLFVGPAGIGKRTLARLLAQALLCEDRPETQLEACGRCVACQMVEAGSHPDLVEVSRPEDKQELPIRVVRDLCVGFGLKPSRGSRKVAIVDDADDINDEAANAFLKTLEEPPPGATLVLIGTSAELQLETIVSRCQVVRFDPLDEESLVDLILKRGLAPNPEEARRLAQLGEGSVSRALEFATGSFEQFRRELLDLFAVPHGFSPTEMVSRLGSFVKQDAKEASDQRRKASLLIGELIRFFRGTLWQTAGLEAPSPDPDDCDGDKWNLTVVFEPDLFNNYGLADRERAMLAARVIELAREGQDVPIVFDLTLNGFGANKNLLTLAFQPPFLAATLSLLIALVIVGWRAFGRFGPPLAEGRAIAFGKARLAANTGGFIRRTGRLNLLSEPYAALVGRRMASRLGLRRPGRQVEEDERLGPGRARREPHQPLAESPAVEQLPGRTDEHGRADRGREVGVGDAEQEQRREQPDQPLGAAGRPGESGRSHLAMIAQRLARHESVAGLSLRRW